MSGETGAWMWLVMDVALVVVLAAALAYGVVSWRKRRGPSADAARERATKELYRREAGADEGSAHRGTE